jgi:hypothetical protein
MECLNCQQPFAEPRPRFCPHCGQESNVKPPTLGEFAQQFGGAYFSTEGALWRTLKLLLIKPGELTRQYLAGRRRHYVLPLRLYLTVSLVVLLALRLVTSIALESPAANASFTHPKSFSMNLGSSRFGVRDNVFYCEDLPAWTCRRLKKKLDVDPASLQRQVLAMGERLMGNLGAAMFVLLPAFALWLKLVYLNRRLRYTEHLVFALHVHAFWFLMLALTLIDQAWLSVIAFIAVPVYTLMAMRRVYGGRFWPRLLRAGVVSALYGVALTMALIGLGWWVLLS